MEYGKPFLSSIFTFNDLHGYLVENPIQTLIIRRHIVFLVWFIKRAWAACDFTITRSLRSNWMTIDGIKNHRQPVFVCRFSGKVFIPLRHPCGFITAVQVVRNVFSEQVFNDTIAAWCLYQSGTRHTWLEIGVKLEAWKQYSCTTSQVTYSVTQSIVSAGSLRTRSKKMLAFIRCPFQILLF